MKSGGFVSGLVLYFVLPVHVTSSLPLETFFGFEKRDTSPVEILLTPEKRDAAANINGTTASDTFREEAVNQQSLSNARQMLQRFRPAMNCNDGHSDGQFRFSCPSPLGNERHRCISSDDLCNGHIDCPKAEDEDLEHCMFYAVIQHQTRALQQVIMRHYDQFPTRGNI